jgi:hypothetical protein
MPAAKRSENLGGNALRLRPLPATAVAALSCCWSAEAKGLLKDIGDQVSITETKPYRPGGLQKKDK